MKNLTILAIILAVIALIVAVTTNNATQKVSGDTLSRIQKTGVIDACTIIDPPSAIKDASTGDFSGYMADAMNIIAQQMNAKVKWHESTWGNATVDLKSKVCDVVVAQFFANISRAQAVAFTKPSLFYLGLSALVRKDDPRFQGTKNVFDFDKPDIKIAVATGEAGDLFIKDNFKNAQIVRIDVEAADITRFALEVSSGRADVAIAGADVTAIYAKAHPEIVDLFKDNQFGLNPIGWAVRQDDSKWQDFLETSLQYLETRGTLSALQQKYDAHLLHEMKQFKIQ